jgi:hypothetical protein
LIVNNRFRSSQPRQAPERWQVYTKLQKSTLNGKYLIIIILSLSFTSFGQNCSMLKNGKYEIQYDTKDRNPSLFEIDGNHYYAFEDGGKKDYEIKILSSDCAR